MSLPNHDLLSYTLEHLGTTESLAWDFPSGKAYLEDVGVLRLEPAIDAQASVVLSVGVHGNETAPIELINIILQRLLLGQIDLSVRLLVIIGHPKAVQQGTRFCDVNLNRLFCGAWCNYQGMEVARAQSLEKHLAVFFAAHQQGDKFHYDLHTAIRGSQYEKFAVHPYPNRAYLKSQFRFYAAIGIEAVLLSHQPTTTFSYHSYINHGAEAATIELGQVRPFGMNNLNKLAALEMALTHLLQNGQLVQGDEGNVLLFKVVDTLVKDAEDYQLNIADEEKNFTAFDVGYVLAQSRNGGYYVKQTGDAIVFPNTHLPVGQRAGLVVRPTTWRELEH